MSLVSAALTDGTLSVTPSTVTADRTDPFTLTFTATMRLAEGTVILQVPAGWPAPQTQTAGTSGYTTCATCTPGTLTTDPSAMTITITRLILAPQGTAIAGPPSSIALTYSATVPPSAASNTFTAMAQQTTRPSTRSPRHVTGAAYFWWPDVA